LQDSLSDEGNETLKLISQVTIAAGNTGKSMKTICTLLLLFSSTMGLNGNAQSNDDIQKLVGSWKLTKRVVDGRQVDLKDFLEIKSVTEAQFIWIRLRKGSNNVSEVGAGPYSLIGDLYSEKLAYGLGTDFQTKEGNVTPFVSRVNGVIWHLHGRLSDGKSIDEEWQQLPPERVLQR
jgi:hypothetical protein